jgi:hypothetical protein
MPIYTKHSMCSRVLWTRTPTHPGACTSSEITSARACRVQRATMKTRVCLILQGTGLAMMTKESKTRNPSFSRSSQVFPGGNDRRYVLNAVHLASGGLTAADILAPPAFPTLYHCIWRHRCAETEPYHGPGLRGILRFIRRRSTIGTHGPR